MGSTHSWTELISTKETLLDLKFIEGMISCNSEENSIRVYGGTGLKALGDIAYEHGLSLVNQGDINKQTIAGACSTGTHGTGITLQSMSNQIAELTLLTPKGDELKISESNEDLFQASRVSLGSMGIISWPTTPTPILL